MALTMLVNTCWGGSDGSPGTDDQDITSANLRFKWIDNNTQDANNKIQIPGAGTVYSKWKHVYLRCSARPGSEMANNVKFYSDGSNPWTGVDIYAGDTLATHTSASNAGYEVDDTSTDATGTDMDTGTPNHTGVTGQTSVFSLTSGSPLDVTIGEASSQIDAVNEVTNFVILQMQVTSSASPASPLAGETLTFSYDES